MQEALVSTGWHNYSLFYRPDGFAVGYFETKDADFTTVCNRMEATDVNAKWQAAMTKYTPDNMNALETGSGGILEPCVASACFMPAVGLRRCVSREEDAWCSIG